MDARLKFRHLRPANMSALKAKIAQVNKETFNIEEKLSLLAQSRDSLHAAQMHRSHFVVWLDACRKHQESARNLLTQLKVSNYENADLKSCFENDGDLSLGQLVEKQSKDFENFINEVIQPINQLRLAGLFSF